MAIYKKCAIANDDTQILNSIIELSFKILLGLGSIYLSCFNMYKKHV